MSLRVLIVDDSPAMRAHIRKALQGSGLPLEATVEAADGVDGLEKLRQNQINLILSDINMPNMDGEEFVRLVKEDKDYRQIPVLVITTDNSAQRVLRMRNLGAVGYICKPFAPDLIRKKIQAILEG